MEDKERETATMSKIPFFVPWVTDEDKEEVLNALSSRWLTGGPKAKEFEERFAGYLGVRHAVSVNSCTAALHLAMRTLNVEAGDEVIVPVFTFVGTANAILYCGAKPVFTDVDLETFNISTESVLHKITKRTKAIIVVHYGGQPANMKEIIDIAEDHDLRVVEDCAHSLGAEYRGRKTGSIGVIGCFSFYPTKIITTLEGGMLTTNEEQIARKARLLREHSITSSALEREKRAHWRYDVDDMGYSYRLNEIQAALGISQLKRVEEGIKKRVEAARYYTRKLNETNGIVTPYRAKRRTHVYHLYAVRISKEKCGLDRDELFAGLSRRGIGLSVHYVPLHLVTFYKRIAGAARFPNAEEVYKEVLSLPLFPTISKSQIDYVTSSLKNCIASTAGKRRRK